MDIVKIEIGTAIIICGLVFLTYIRKVKNKLKKLILRQGVK